MITKKHEYIVKQFIDLYGINDYKQVGIQYFDEIIYEVTLDLLQAIETNELSSISQASQVYDQIVLDRIYIETVVQFMEEFDIKKYDSIMDELRKDFIKRCLAIYKE